MKYLGSVNKNRASGFSSFIISLIACVLPYPSVGYKITEESSKPDNLLVLSDKSNLLFFSGWLIDPAI